MNLDIGEIWQWFLLANAIGTIVLSILVMWLGTKFTKRSEHAALAGRVEVIEKEQAAFERRLAEGSLQFQFIEKSIAALPTRDHVSEIKQLVMQVEGHARVVEEQGKNARELFRILERRADVIESFVRDLQK